MFRKRINRILRGTMAAVLVLALVAGAAGCGKKDDAAAQTDAAQESALDETDQEPINPEEMSEEAKEEIRDEDTQQAEEEVKEEVKEEAQTDAAEDAAADEAAKPGPAGDQASDEQSAAAATAKEEKQESTVIEKPGPSEETASEQGADEDKEEENEAESEEEKEDEGPKGLALLDGIMRFDGMDLTFPIDLDGMTLGSWKLEYVNVDDPSSRTLAPGEVVTAQMTSDAYTSDDVTVTAEFGNYTDSDAALTDLPMTGIYITKGKGKDGNEPKLPEVEMPGGLTWGSSEEEIRELFGEASLSGTFDKDFDFMYENGEYMVEFAGMNDTGLDYIVYCKE